MNLLSSVTL